MSRDTPLRWQRQADRINERRRQEAPLLARAGLVQEITPAQRRAQVLTRLAGQEAALGAIRSHLCGDIVQRIRLLSAFLEPESLEALAEYRWRVLPPTVEYGADFWRGVWERLRRGDPAQDVPRFIAPSAARD